MITATKVEPSKNHEAAVASGVWSIHDQYQARRGGLWPEAGITNPDTLVENNFSCTLYTGNATDDRAVTTGIDLANNKGLVWVKSRAVGQNHILVDTVRGIGKQVNTAQDDVEESQATTVKSFTSTGITLGTHDRVNDGDAGEKNYVAWSFKAAPNFFDVVKYEGTGSARTVAHSLGSAPGCIWIKNLDQSDSWAVYHRANTAAPETDYLILDTEAVTADNANWWNDTAPTSSVFTVGTDHAVNASGENYIAYIFGHDTSSSGMIQCGGYTGNNSTTGTVVDIGFEPQWIFIRHTDANGNSAHIFDSPRVVKTGGIDNFIAPNANQDEQTSADKIEFNASGFQLKQADGALNGDGNKYIYIAIRQNNMKTITDATEVFDVKQGRDSQPAFNAPFKVDMTLQAANISGTVSWRIRNRLTNENYLITSGDDGETASTSNTYKFNQPDGTGYGQADNLTNVYAWMWQRAKSYFDIVTYNGTGSAKTEAHGLGVPPEMMWIKRRSGAVNWGVYYGDNTDRLVLNDNRATGDFLAYWNDTSPTSSVFTLGDDNDVNGGGETYIAYLFATLAGVSKIGTVAHSGSSTDVDCGFTSGARLVMLKRVDATGDWFWFDSLQGIVAGNDPYLLLNSTNSQVTNTDYIDPLSSGFTITGDFTDGTYLFYAIA